jgi:hypothetical protein
VRVAKSPLAALCRRSALESHPRPARQLVIIHRQTASVSRGYQHPGADQLKADVSGWAGIPRSRGDSGGLGQDVVTVISYLASPQLATDLAKDNFLQAATYCSEVECRMSRSRWLRRASRSRAWRYWGLVLVAMMVIGLGGLPVAAYVVMTLLVIVWTLFAAPVWCGAVNREHG